MATDTVVLCAVVLAVIAAHTQHAPNYPLGALWGVSAPSTGQVGIPTACPGTRCAQSATPRVRIEDKTTIFGFLIAVTLKTTTMMTII